MGFTYVLLGKFQTDPLELRFSKYRRMSGTNYHISIQQILESERKLKVTGLLRLKSHLKGEIPFKHFFADFTSSLQKQQIYIEEEEDIIRQSFSVDITDSDIRIIMYVSGYAVKKIAKVITCNGCKTYFESDKTNLFELDHCEYLVNLDRGGLKYPSELITNIGICAYQIFQVLISQQYEENFLKYENQKYVLVLLILERTELEDVSECSCGKNLFEYFEKVAVIWANILLNNYTKNINNENHSLWDIKSRKKKFCNYLVI